MRRVGWMALVLFLTVLGTASSALAQKRVALVIGNGTYTKVARLDNPKNDAAAMEAMAIPNFTMSPFFLNHSRPQIFASLFTSRW